MRNLLQSMFIYNALSTADFDLLKEGWNEASVPARANIFNKVANGLLQLEQDGYNLYVALIIKEDENWPIYGFVLATNEGKLPELERIFKARYQQEGLEIVPKYHLENSDPDEFLIGMLQAAMDDPAAAIIESEGISALMTDAGAI